jgi:hypothetical protein
LPLLAACLPAQAAFITVDPDVDQDRDVDGVDFAKFATCFNKAGNPPRTLGCSAQTADAFDSDDDGDVDGVDFAVFANCFNKAGRPPRCAPPPPVLQSITHAADRSAGGYEVVLIFNNALDGVSAQNVNHYRITASAAIPTSATLSPDSLSVTLIFNHAVAIADTLDLSVGGAILDAYGQAVAQQLALPIAANGSDVADPTATIDFAAAQQVTVHFTEALDQTSAETLSNYFNLDDNAAPIAATLLDDGQTVLLTFADGTDWDLIRVSTADAILDINGHSMTQDAFVLDALLAGASAKPITPVTPNGTPLANPSKTVNHSDPVYLAGFGDNRPATGVHDELWARCLVLRFADTTVGIVALDLVGYSHNEIENIRALLSPGAGIDYVLVTSTHNHEGPDTIGIWGPDPLTSGIDPNYLDFVNDAVVEALEEAAAALAPAQVKIATADSAGLSIGTDPEDDGFGVGDTKVLVGDDAVPGNIAGRVVDPNISIMQFVDADTLVTIASFMAFGSHPESMGSGNTLITSDFPHSVRERLESTLGGIAVYVSGALGVLQGPLHIDVLDPLTSLPAPRRTFRFAEVHGQSLADRALSALSVVTQFSAFPKIDFRTTAPVDVPLANPYFRFFIGQGTIGQGRDLFTNGILDTSTGVDPTFGTIPIPLGEDLRSEVGALRIADAGVAVLPSELDPQIGIGYRLRLNKADHTLIIGLGNDLLGYQLPFGKWDDSCHACAYYDIAGQPCPVSPVDCNTVFANNVGPQMDPILSGAINLILNDLNASGWTDVDAPAVHIVETEAELLAAANQNARPGDIIQVVAGVTIASNTPITPPAGVTITTLGAPADTALHVDLDYSLLEDRAIRPDGLIVENLTLGGLVILYDVENVIIRNCVIDPTAGGGPVPDTDGIRLNAFDRNTGSLTVENCVVKNVGRDGISLDKTGLGAAINAAGYVLTVNNCNVTDNIGYASEPVSTHQALTTHAGGTLIVNGGTYAGHPTARSISAGSGTDPVIVNNAVCTGAGFSAAAAKGCTINCLGSNLTMSRVGAVPPEFHDNTVTDFFLGGFTGDGWSIKRSTFVTTDTGTTTAIRHDTPGALMVVESCVIIGHPTASASFGIAASGNQSPRRTISVINTTFHDLDVGLAIDDEYFRPANLCTIRNNIFLNVAQPAVASGFSTLDPVGGNNYYDVGSAPYADNPAVYQGDTEFPAGDGALAYSMTDYNNDNFRPTGPGNYIKAKGQPLATPTLDRDGNPFVQANPTLGAFEAP